MYADPYRRAMRRLLDQADPKELEEVLADFMTRASDTPAVPLDPQIPACPPRPRL